MHSIDLITNKIYKDIYLIGDNRYIINNKIMIRRNKLIYWIYLFELYVHFIMIKKIFY